MIQAKLTTAATSAPLKVEDATAVSTKRSRPSAAEADQVPSSSSSSSSGSFVQAQTGPAPPQPPPPAHLLLTAGRPGAGVGAAHIKLTSRSQYCY